MKVQTWITWATAILTIVYLVCWSAPTIDFAVLSSRPSAPLTAVLWRGLHAHGGLRLWMD